MPYFKKRDFVTSAIESALSQTFQDFEILLVYDDNNLSDYQFIKKFEEKDQRIKVLKNKNKLGAGLSRNLAIDISKKKFIAFLDCDDLWKNNKLERQINFMNKNNINITYTAYDIIDNSNRKIGSRLARETLDFQDLIKSCDIGLSTVILERSVLNNNCKFASLKTKEDYVLWLSLAKKNYKFYGINEVLAEWRKLDNSLSSSTFQKLIDGYRVYNSYMKYNKILSFVYLFRLSLNYLFKK